MFSFIIMNAEEKLELIKRNTEEIITEEELKALLKKKKNPSVYCGYELSGEMHLGHMVTITKLNDLQRAGFGVKILLADVHTLLNRKDEKVIKKEIESWKKTIKAVGLKCEFVLGSDFQFKKEYQLDVIKLAQHSTINRGLRSMQEIAREAENATISQLWYPLMQVVDIKHLKVDVALGGIEQRKVHMIGKDLNKILDYNFIAIHTPLITSLKGPGQKMSRSIPDSGLIMISSADEIKKTILEAYCPAKEIKDNPILQIVKLIIFPRLNKVKINRPSKFGGDVMYYSHEELEKDFAEGKLHPADLKNAIIKYLEEIISPIRKSFNKHG